MATRCNLITGFLGAGKTTLIRHLLSQRPADERWAVIVNEFGVVGIDGTTLAAVGAGQSAVQVREVAGGCICCAANVPLRVAITDVLRRVRPDRLLIEPSGLGHPAAILATLAEPGLAKALVIGAVICVVDAGRPLPGALSGGAADVVGSTAATSDTIAPAADPLDDTWHDQLAMADVVVANKRDRVDPPGYQAFLCYAGNLYPPKQEIVATVEGRVDAALLDAPRARWRPALAAGHGASVGAGVGASVGATLAAGRDLRHAAGALAQVAPPHPVPGLGTRHAAGSAGTASIGWLFDDPARAAAVFDADRIDRLMIRLAPMVASCGARLLRAKGALRTDHGTRLVEWSSGQVRSSPLTFDGPSRFELLFDGTDGDDRDRGDATAPMPGGDNANLIADAIEPALQEALGGIASR